jgi:Flp pilus assembly protein TadD
VRKSPDDWHVWLVAARIQAKRGELAAARRSLRRARSLNPRSPLFARG